MFSSAVGWEFLFQLLSVLFSSVQKAVQVQWPHYLSTFDSILDFSPINSFTYYLLGDRSSGVAAPDRGCGTVCRLNCDSKTFASPSLGGYLTLWVRTAGYPAVHTSLVYKARDNPRNCGRLENYLYGPRDTPRRTQRLKTFLFAETRRIVTSLF